MKTPDSRYVLSSLEVRFEAAWLEFFPNVTLVRQHKFHPKRRWRLDYIAAYAPVAIELQGAIYTNGAHSRPSGQKRDMEKNNHAVALGWRMFYLHTDNVEDLSALRLIADTITQLIANNAPMPQMPAPVASGGHSRRSTNTGVPQGPPV